MSEKKNNRRKGLAVALAVVGVAGLSLASASQLTINMGGTVQAGSQVLVDCQTTPVTVTYSAPKWVGGQFVVDGATISDVQDSCAGKKFTLVALQGAIDLESESGTLPAAPVGDVSVTFGSAFAAAAVDGVALTIHS